MVRKKYFLGFSLLLAYFFCMSFLSAWTLSGNVTDVNGIPVADANITVNMLFMPGGAPPITLHPNSTNSSGTGAFSLEVYDNSSINYQITVRHKNSSYGGAIDLIGQTLPYFPYQEVSRNISTNFFLKPAGTINITAINSTGDRLNFSYQVKDTTLGFILDSAWSQGGVSEVDIAVPTERNYSIMIFPQNSMPLTFNWDNFTSPVSYNDTAWPTALLRYNATTKTIHKTFNTTMGFSRFIGNINASSLGVHGFDNFTLIPYILQPGNMVFMTDNPYGAMPYNMSAWQQQSDIYNYADGTFNITLPAPAESQTVLVYVAARNGSNYYGSYKNITLSYGTAIIGSNITMYGLLGTVIKRINMSDSSDWSLQKQSLTLGHIFNFTNSSGVVPQSLEAHLEIEVDYTNFGGMPFTFMTEASGGATGFTVPLLNVTGIKELNVFTQGFAPRRIAQKTVAQLLANSNITLSSFNPQALEGNQVNSSMSGSNIKMMMMVSNTSCDIPNPGSGCFVGSPTGDMGSFSPMSALIGGGKISFRMGTAAGVYVHYVNVDMLASGPPDALFDNDQGTNKGSGNFSNMVKFGSKGPTIYDYVLVSMPYVDGPGGLKENVEVNLSIPVFYDEDWNVVWNISSNGSMGALAGNDSHYSVKVADWANLTVSKTCRNVVITSATEINATNPCYIDLARNRIWVRLPHFSGTAPTAVGASSSLIFTNLNNVSFLSPTPTSGNFISRNHSVIINVTANLTNFMNMSVYLYNSTGDSLRSDNSTDPTFSVNYSSLGEGLYFVIANATNFSSWSNSTETRNFTIDTIYPTVTNLSAYDTNNSVVNRNNIFLYMNCSDTNFANITIRLYNASSSLINSSTSSTATNISINFTSLSDVDGLYFYDTIVYDKALNYNVSNLRQVILNSSSLVFSSVSSTPSTTTATISYTSNKSVNATLAYGTSKSALSSSGTAVTILSTSGSFSLTGLSVSTTYHYNITICDRAGNCVVNGTNNFTTSAATSDTTATPGSGATATIPTTVNLADGYTKIMVVADELKFNIGTQQHSIFVQRIVGDTLTLKIASDPQIATFKAGDEKKFEVTGDNYYDLYIKLNSLKVGLANLTIRTINEIMPGTNALTNVTAPNASVPPATPTPEGAEGSAINVKTIVGIVLAVVIIVGVVWYFFARAKKKRYY
jgi:hypothetical protein